MSDTTPNHSTARDEDAESQRLADLADDFAARLRRGERPSVEEYARQHPALADQIRELFPAMLLMERESVVDPTLVDSTPAAALNREQPGTMVGRYKLLERVGEGGFGLVFMAEQRHPVRR